MACLELACGVLAAAWGELCRPHGPNAGLCGPKAPVGHLCKRGAAAGLTLAGWKGADAPRRARRARTSTRRCGQRSFPCAHPPTARARAYCGLRLHPATPTLHSCAQAQQTCQHGKILPVPHGSASCMGKLVWQAPSVLGVLEPVGLVWRPPRQQQSVTILSIHVIICCHGVARAA